MLRFCPAKDTPSPKMEGPPSLPRIQAKDLDVPDTWAEMTSPVSKGFTDAVSKNKVLQLTNIKTQQIQFVDLICF